MEGALPILLFVGFFVLIIIAGIYGAKKAKERREALMAMAQRLGLRYRRERDRGLASELRLLNRLRLGSNRYCENVVSGDYEGAHIMAFDYHYETHSTDSKGNRQTHHHWQGVMTLRLERFFPELTIAEEGFFSKIGQALGFPDIDFESHEFSRKFKVKSKDKKFAYDFCNALMIEYLLENTDLTIEVDEDQLAIFFSRRLPAEAWEPNFQRLRKLRELMPDYLFENV